jgi:hypothetical protein
MAATHLGLDADGEIGNLDQYHFGGHLQGAGCHTDEVDCAILVWVIRRH